MFKESLSEKLAKMHAHIYKINGEFYVIGQWTFDKFNITNSMFDEYQEAIQQFDNDPNPDNEKQLLKSYTKFKRIGNDDHKANCKISRFVESLSHEELTALEKQVCDNVRVFNHFYKQGYFHS